MNERMRVDLEPFSGSKRARQQSAKIYLESYDVTHWTHVTLMHCCHNIAINFGSTTTKTLRTRVQRSIAEVADRPKVRPLLAM